MLKLINTNNKPAGVIVNAELLQTAAANVITSGNREQFIIERKNGAQSTCSLATLSALVNELHEDIKVIASLQQNTVTAAINAFCPVSVFWH